MSKIITLTLGLFFIFMSFSYFYKQRWVIKVNSFFRDKIFNDSLVLKSKRFVAVVLLLIGLILLYWAL